MTIPRAACLAVLVFLACPALAGPDTQCPEIPQDLVVIPGEPVHLGPYSVTLKAYLKHVPGEPAPHPDGAPLALDLYASPARRPGFVPNLSVTVDGGGLPAPLPLPARMTGEGPAYGADLPPTSYPVSLQVAVQEGPGTAHPDHGSECPGLPLNLRVRVELPGYGEPWGEGPGVDAGSGLRMVLRSALDVRPSDAYANLWGWNDGTTYLAIIGSSSGTAFLDVTDPDHPVEVGFVAGPSSSWREIKTYRDWAYIVTEGSGTGQGLQIVSLEDPQAPVLVNTFAGTFATAHTLFIDEAAGIAYLNGTNNGQRILSLADPVNPVEIGSWGTRYVHDSWAAGGLACYSEIYQGLQELLDVSDPANPQVLSTWTTPGAFTHNCWANPDATLLVTTDENSPGGALTVYDISQKNVPAPQVARYQPVPQSTVHNAYFEDGDPRRVAMSHYGIGIRLVDLHRPSAPVELGGYDTYPSGDSGYNGAWGVYPYDPRGYLYVSDIQSGFFLVEYVPTGGTLSGVVREAGTAAPIPGARVVDLLGGGMDEAGPDGVYALYAPAGGTQVRVTAPGYVSRVALGPEMPLDGRADLDLSLERLPRVALSGTVRRADTAAPVAGATVRLVGTALAAVTGPDGTYAFPEVSVGPQAVTAEAWGYGGVEGRTLLAQGVSGVLDLALVPGRLADDAEAVRGWAPGVPGDTATSGAWTRVDPVGTNGGTVQPEDDATPAPGVTAFITGQAAPGDLPEANDVDNGFTTLLSPRIDAAGLGAARVGYARWLSVNAGLFNGGRLLVQASSDDGATWTTLEDTSSQAASWTRKVFDLPSTFPLTGQMRLRMRAEAGASSTRGILEAGIDDVEVVGACAARLHPGAPDADRDGTVDACDPCPQDAADDADGDGRCGNLDNAPRSPNPGQEDADGDGVGDAGDLCPAAADPAQRDLDADGLGDACDPDLDGDGIADGADPDRDQDGVADALDPCPTVPGAAETDRDGDGTGDACDTDDGEVQGLRLRGPDLSWEPEAGAAGYHLYRGDLGAAALVPLAACRASGLPTAWTADLDLPNVGDGFFYLVSRQSAGGEGPLGRDSAGREREVNVPCP